MEEHKLSPPFSWTFGGLGCPGSQHANSGLARIIGFAIYEDLDGLVRVSGLFSPEHLFDDLSRLFRRKRPLACHGGLLAFRQAYLACAPPHIVGTRLGPRSPASKEMRHGLNPETLARLHGFDRCPDDSDGSYQPRRLSSPWPLTPERKLLCSFSVHV